MKILKLCMGMAVIVLLSSCENRDDIFHQYNSTPDVYVNSGSRDFSQKKSEVTVLIRHGQSESVYYDYSDDYLEKGVNVDFSIFTENDVPGNLTCSLDKDARRLVITDTLPTNTLNDKILKYKIKITVSDYYGDKGEAIINIVNCDNMPPSAVVELTYISGLEYIIDASSTTDPDGDAVSAYEYLIDGVTTIDQSGYEDEADASCLLNRGMAGQQGTYIVSTIFSSVKHAFQSTGAHVIYVRVRDSLGLWSKWSKFNLYIE